MTFRVGQKVVCVDDTAPVGFPPSPLVKGDIYTISCIFENPFDGNVALLFFEIESEGPDWLGYRPRRFRPIVDRKTDISIFTEMLTGIKVDA